MSTSNLLAIFKSNNIPLVNGSCHDTFEKLILHTDDISLVETVMESILVQAEAIAKAISVNPKVTGETISTFSIGLQSKSTSISHLTCRILTRMANHLRSVLDKASWRGVYRAYQHMLTSSNVRFIAHNGLFVQCRAVLSTHRIDRSVMSVIEQFAQADIKHFLVTHLGGNIVGNAHFIHKLLEHCERNAVIRGLIESEGVPIDLAPVLIRGLDTTQSHERLPLTYCLSYLYCTYVSAFDVKSSGTIVQSMKKCCHDISPSGRAASISCIIDIIQLYLSRGDKRSLDLFRFTALVLLENYGDSIEGFIQASIIKIIDGHPKIPAQTLVDPILRFFKTNPPRNTDFDLLVTLAKHPSVEGTNAIHLFEFLWPIATSHVFFGRAAMIPILTLMNRLPDLCDSLVSKYIPGVLEEMLKQPESPSSLISMELLLSLYELNIPILRETLNLNITIFSGQGPTIAKLRLYISKAEHPSIPVQPQATPQKIKK